MSHKKTTAWDHEYHTLRREHLFRHPPTDRTAYPALERAVEPHIKSFNAVFREGNGLLVHGLKDIGTHVFLDGSDSMDPKERNRLHIRIKSVSLQPSMLPSTNKFARTREVYPSECRLRQSTYRGRLTAVFECRVNDGERFEFPRDLGLLPLMVKVSQRLANALPSRPISC